MKIALDAMGSDTRPVPDVDGAVQAAREFGITVILVGDQDKIKTELAKYDTRGLDLPIVHAAGEIAMTEHVDAVKAKKDASMNVAVRMVKQKEADAIVTMGNSGAAMAAALFGLGRIRGIERPALGSAYPTAKGRCFLLDIGVNTEVKPEYLYQFAIMGAAYAQRVMGLASPRVALLSVGEEEGKGPLIVREAYALLKQNRQINFVGNVEGKDVPRGEADVVVSDGYAGNIVIKLSEGLAETLVGFIKAEIKKRPVAIAGAALAKPAFDALKTKLDYAEFGGGILLGVDGVTIIGHGRSNAKAIKNAIRVGKQAVEGNMLDAIRKGL
ncbi:MAG: phosphate acyltransferase PlsX [Chloroflexi bacterium]|nr:phosphate acyltransferase PlsX [Chloroflexota bacterium]